MPETTEDLRRYECTACDGVVFAEPDRTAKFCPYCGGRGS